ncbi:GDSL-type esterase/lipase family protein [Agromyces albus]|uniref:SGNH hydrolase-type esterase domain-containing protein n=1 Tax=Agromyces albus TaxID=205332 RepID=A0A4Q2KWZ4_9MICO|nr:GDSL-type esterase/lipase family protein [Agromyces albus]RXZ68061.1 hypothetical protein ESP51_14995 [Agromyces albus]
MSFLQRLIYKKFLEPAHQMKVSQFEELTPPPGAVVFLGDSITAGGAWHEWFPTHSVVNRGIDGDTSAGVRKRVGVTLNNALAAVSLLIGTNDITWGRKNAEILADLRATLATIREQAPEARILLHGIMPRQAKFRDRIDDLNTDYRRIAEDTDGAVYVDLWPTLASGDSLRADFTLDGLHLNGAAYRAWADAIRPLLPPIER